MHDEKTPPASVPARDQPLAKEIQSALIRELTPFVLQELAALVDERVPPATQNLDRKLLALNVLAHVVGPLLCELSPEDQAGFVHLLGGMLARHDDQALGFRSLVPGGKGRPS